MAKARVLILGAGFGGLFAARHLSRHAGDDVAVEIVDEHNYFVFQPLLPEVVGASINPADAVAPLRLLLPGVKAREARVVDIDLAGGRVEVVQGGGRDLRSLGYDHLVIALGQVADLGRYPGLAEHGFTLKDLADAFRLRNHLIACLEQADIEDRQPVRRRLLTFVVIGGGLSGIEAAGELEDMLRRALRFYPRLRRDEIRIVVVEYQPRILPELPESLAAYAARRLQRRGIEIWTGLGVKSASAEAVELGGGRVVATATAVVTIGNSPSPLIGRLACEKRRGRIVTDRHLRVPGLDNVWALGDVAWIPLADAGDPPPTAPLTAQAARQEAAVLAGNILAVVRGVGLAPVAYESRGQLASLGGRRGIAEVMGFELSGFLAWVLWRSVYLALLPGLATKARVAMDWALNTVFPRNIVQLQQAQPRAVRRSFFRAGEVVFTAGEATGPLYVVLSGSFLREDGQAAVIGAGGRFGDGSLRGERRRRATVTAREDSLCLALAGEDLRQLAKNPDGLAASLEFLKESEGHARRRDAATR